jgi:predicted TIM-barrel fold metal-dependent hydrolase
VNVIDADMHVMEPADLWTKAGLPIEGHGWNGVTIEGHRLPDAPGEWPTDDEAYAGGPAAVYAGAQADGFGPASTVAAMDREGISTAILLPTRAACVVGADGVDPLLVARACTAYNQWVAAYCQGARGRLGAVALVGLHDVQQACAAAAYAVQELGLMGVVTRPNPVADRTLDHPDYDVFYRVVAGLGVPLILHEGTGAHLPTLGLERAMTYLEAHAMSHPFEQMAAVLHMTVGGVLERHPALRVGFFEAGAGWLPWWLERLDDHALGLFGSKEYRRERRPSFYFKRQGFVTMEPGEDLHGIEAAGLGGNVLFASDYPHGDSHFPNAVREARIGAGRLWQRVSYDNAVAFFGPPGADVA